MSDIVENIKEETDDFYTNDDLYNINSWGVDLSFRELITMYNEQELVKPELQRKYVWDKTEASRFIDSLLLGLPVPSIFLANTKDNRKLIIDGYQRIMTVYDYVKGLWSTDKSVFKLVNSDRINSRWKGKAFSELSDSDQRKIRSTTIHGIVFEQSSPEDDDTSLYQIFERINTSGRTLMPQEIRNCVYQGPLNSLLFELNKNNNWRSLFGEELEDTRMRDLEFILRFFALNSEKIKSLDKGTISLKKFLNVFMGYKSNNSLDAIESFKELFEAVIFLVKTYFGENAFYNVLATDLITVRKRFYPTVFDSVMIATAIAYVNGFEFGEDLEHKRLELLKNADYRKYITQGTMSIEHIQGRISMVLRNVFGMNY
jgi:uncharacterized protein with ParB-like and HNH nuclease domain